MTQHNTTRNETPPLAGESASGQTSGLCAGEYSTPRPAVQPLERRVSVARHGHAYLVGSAPANVVALSFISHQPLTPTLILSVEEAQALGRALLDMAGDLDCDRRARAWSEELACIVAAADGSAESYASKL